MRFALFVLATAFPLMPLQAQVKTVWQIGTFDQSPVEFSARPAGHLVFHIGSSNAEKDWPGTQSTGTAYQVVFALDSVSGSYELKIATLIEKPRVPALQIDVNGHSGLFYLHPKLSYSRSDFSYAFDPHESQSLVRAAIPSSYLKSGDNRIAIRLVDEPETPAGEEELGGISYDALSLEQNPAANTATRAISVEAEPTIFFRRQGASLVEVVDAFFSFPHPWTATTASLEVSGQHYTALIPAGDFGERRVSFELPEWSGTQTVRIRVNTPGAKAADVSLTAQRKWSIFVVPHTHLDVGFTDYQGKVAEMQARILTQAAGLIHQHPDFRFSMDGSWNLQQVIETRPEDKQSQVLDLIRSGKMGMPVQYCNLLTGYASLETLYRSLYTSKALSREHQLPFEYANITDVPTYSGTYPSVLAASGVKYWVAAANNDRAPIFYYEHWNEKSPFWWEGPDGGKVLFWYSRHYEQVQSLFGLLPQLTAVRESLPIYLQAYSKPAYKPDVALLYGTQVENTDLVPATATFAGEWDKEYAFPKLTYATFADFFHYIDAHFAADLPTVKGDGGGYWEDGVGSDAYSAAEDRKNQNRALSAEILSSATHSVNPNLNPPTGLFTDIWRNIILFAEHTWLSYNSVSQPDHEEAIRQLRVKDGRVEQASLEIGDVMNRSLDQLADEIHIPSGTLVVFNSLNWKRSDLIETDLLDKQPSLTDLTTREPVPLEILSRKEGFVHVRFQARDLPPVGYKCFSVSYGSNGPGPEARTTSPETVENSFYRITIDAASGALSSIYDKQLNRELVDGSSPYKFGQYLYVTGGDGDTRMINPFPALPPGQLAVHPAGDGKLVAMETTPWGHSIRLQSSDLNTPRISTEILLFNDEKKIQFSYRLHKDYTTAKEAVYFAFPSAASPPRFTYATQQGWVDPAHDILKGGSLEWFNVQHWMAVHDDRFALGIVPVDASLASFGDINRGLWPGEFKPKSATIYSYAMNNYWHTNYRAGQGGDFTFRFVVTSSPQLDGGALSRLGFESMRPAELDTVTTQDKVGDPQRPLPPEGRGFLETGSPTVALVTWKKAEDNHGMILRLQEIAGKASHAEVQLPGIALSSAFLCNGVEDNVRPLPLDGKTLPLSFRPFEVQTVRIENAR